MSPQDPFFRPDSYLLDGSTYTILRSDADTVGAYCLVDVVVPAGWTTLPHVHMLETQAIYVISGTLTLEAVGERHEVGPGMLRVLAEGVAHRWSNLADTESHYLLFCAPAGFDDLVREIGIPIGGTTIAAVRGAPNDGPKRLLTAAPRHGITILSPEALAIRHQPQTPIVPRTMERTDALGLRTVILGGVGETADSPVLLRTALRPGGIVPLHGHPEREMVLVTAGQLEAYRGRNTAAWTPLAAGDVMDLPSGIPHALRNAADDPAEAFVVTSWSLMMAARRPPEPTTPTLPGRLQALLPEPTPTRRTGYWSASADENADIGLPLPNTARRGLLH